MAMQTAYRNGTFYNPINENNRFKRTDALN
jgi:hypothetical protein